MSKFIMATVVVLIIIYIVPFMVYGIASALAGLQPPAPVSPGKFLLGVLLTKIGTAVAFVAIFYVSRAIWGRRWFSYALLWFIMFAFSELGEAFSGRTAQVEALLGALSEAIYAPLSGWLTWKILGPNIS